MIFACGVAALFSPGLVSAAGAVDFTPGPGAYTADTSALTLTGPGVNLTGANMGGVAVFSFNNINIPAGATIFATGSRPFEFSASGSFNLAGEIAAGGTTATDFVAGPNAGGAGGGFGGTDGSQPGGGSGGGQVASAGANGGGGGGFGGAGAPGGCSGGSCPSGQSAGTGGTAYGNLDVLFQGGSGGGGGTVSSMSPVVGGGGGGGAVAIFASSATVAAGGEVTVDGGNGAVGNFGASGGGSGGAILIRANTVNIQGLLSARGGQGGAGGGFGQGGGGGGGRISLQYSTLVSAGTADVTGGTSGTYFTPSDPLGPFGPGGASPVPQAANGVVSQVRGSLAGQGPATGVSQTAATISGFVNPNGNPTTYHFDFGTTTAYGMQVPGFDVSVGSDFAVHQVTQTVSGLAPNTTYHYRVVATDSLGLVTLSPDAFFTTLPLPPPSASATVAPLGSGATIVVSCSGGSGQTCAGRFSVTAHKHTCAGKTTAVTARSKPKCKPKTTRIMVGSGSYSVGAGRSQTIHFSVNRTGKSLLTQFYKLPTTWTFTGSSGSAPRTRQVKFAYQRVMATPDDFNLAVGSTSALVKSWFITGIPSGGTVVVVCNGGGCSFHTKTFKNKHKVSILSGARLAVGDTIRITVNAPNSVGMVDTITIRSLDAPKESFSCLPPGARSPMKCVR